VVGTGNKVEDFGVMFFTLGGDGQVDISPIGDLLKTQVKGLATHLGISDEIVEADPTDGLWKDNRTDESAIGATYEELEWAMDFCDKYKVKKREEYKRISYLFDLPRRKEDVLEIYLERHERGMHKIIPIPVCKIPHECKIPTDVC
jgi:NAD+ synthase